MSFSCGLLVRIYYPLNIGFLKVLGHKTIGYHKKFSTIISLGICLITYSFLKLNQTPLFATNLFFYLCHFTILTLSCGRTKVYT